MNLKIAVIASGVFFVLIGASYIKGCNDGQEKAALKWEAKYNRLLLAEPKVETKIDTVYIPRKVSSGKSLARKRDDLLIEKIDSLELDVKNLATPKSTRFYVSGGGLVEVVHWPLRSLENQFTWEVLEAESEKIERVETIVTKTAVEYVQVSVFEQAEFYVGLAVFGVIGYAFAGGF